MSWFLNWGILIIVILGDLVCCRVAFVWNEQRKHDHYSVGTWSKMDVTERFFTAIVTILFCFFWPAYLVLYGPYKLMTMPTREQRRAKKAAKVAASQAEAEKQLDKIWQEYPELRLPERLLTAILKE